MNAEEMSHAYETILGEWEQPWSEHRKKYAARLWRDLDGQTVLAAIDQLLGREFPPTPGLIREKAVELTEAASGLLWAEVWDEIMRWVSSLGHQRWDEIPWSPGVRPFMEHVGSPTFRELCTGEEAKLPVYEAQWREKFHSWQRRQRKQAATENLPATKAFQEQRRAGLLGDGRPAQQIAALATRKQLGKAG